VSIVDAVLVIAVAIKDECGEHRWRTSRNAID
jgi:hypothetical protein